jgi:mannosyl-oligosaccharide alpha-1,2-mannosidase
VLSNKNTGCDATSDRYGYSLYMNSWQTKDHKVYLEYGNQFSGCEKIASTTALQVGQWYHLAFVLSPSTAILFVNGQAESVKTLPNYQPHVAQGSLSLRLGKQPDVADSPYPFSAFVSHLVIAHVNEQEALQKEGDASLNTKAFWEATVKQLLILTSSSDPPAIFTKKGLPSTIQVYYPLNDAPKEDSEFTEESPSPHARDLSPNQWHGDYHLAMMSALSLSEIAGVGEFATGLGEHIHGALSETEMASRADAVRNAMRHAWGSYEKHAFGRDELKPISGRGHDNWGGLGVTLVDSLDTLWLMGLKDEFWRAKDWVRDHLSFDHTGTVSFFETTIRELGGLLSAYDLSGDQVFLDKAQDLGNRLASAFSTPTGLPKGQVNLQSSSAAGGWTGSNSVLAELGTVQLEFNYLSAKTGDKKFSGYANRVYDVLEKLNPQNGLFPIYINANNGQAGSHMITFGALGDSFYEYLLKVWVQTGRKDRRLRNMYDKAMDGMVSVLLKKSSPSNLLYVSDFDGSRNINKMDHLVCFLPGTLALGAWLSDDPDGPRAKRDMAVAKGLMYTCYQMYARQATGISPEYVNFGGQSDFNAGPSANFYILRPETAESLYVMHSITGNPIYAEWSYQIFSSIEKYCKTSLAYGSLSNVNDASAGRRIDDRMESFFLGETLKYLFLAQAPANTVDLHRQVFNTEAHPLSTIE